MEQNKQWSPWGIACVLVLFAAALRVYVALNTALIGTDSMAFLKMAQDFKAGNIEEAVKREYHPLYPLITAGVSYLFDIETSAIAVSILLGSLAIFPLLFLFRDIWGERIAVIAMLIYGVHHHFVGLQSEVMTDGTFIFFLAGSLGSTWFAIKQWNLWLFALGAVCAILAFLTRVEGILLVPFIALWTVVYALRSHEKTVKKILLTFGTYALVALAGILPYMIVIHHITGKWQITMKASAVNLLKDQGEAKEETYDAKDGQPLGNNALFSIADGFVDLLLVFVKAMSWTPLLFFAIAVVFYRRLKPETCPEGDPVWTKPQTADLFFLISLTALFYSAYLIANIRSGHPISYRYLLTPAVLLFPFAAVGILESGGWLGSKIARGKFAKNVALILLFVAVASMVPPSLKSRRHDEIHLLDAAKIIRELRPNLPRIMSTTEKIAYYAEGKLISLPGDYQGIIETATKERADFVLFMGRSLEKRGKELLEKLRGWDGVEREWTFGEGEKAADRVHLFKLKEWK